MKSCSSTRAGHERDLARRLVGRDPAGDGLDLGLRAVAEDVLEQDPQRVRQPRDVPLGLQRVEPVDRVRLVSDRAAQLAITSIQAEAAPSGPWLPWVRRLSVTSPMPPTMFPAAARPKLPAMNVQLHVRAVAVAEDQLERDHDHVVEAAEREHEAGDPGDDDARRASTAWPSTNHVIAVISAPAKTALMKSASTPFAWIVCAVSHERRCPVPYGSTLCVDEDQDHHEPAEHVEDRRGEPELREVAPRAPPSPVVEAGERDEEVLGEELAAADDEEDEADPEAERAEARAPRACRADARAATSTSASTTMPATMSKPAASAVEISSRSGRSSRRCALLLRPLVDVLRLRGLSLTASAELCARANSANSSWLSPIWWM